MNHHSNRTDGYQRLHALFSGVLMALLSGVLMALLFAAGYVSCWVIHRVPGRFIVSCLQ